MDVWKADDYPLPEWAEKRSSGDYMEPGAQLATRDGRRTGNAYVDHVVQHEALGQLAVVVTDMGNTFRMTATELEEAFYRPAYVMHLAEARRARGRDLTAKLAAAQEREAKLREALEYIRDYGLEENVRYKAREALALPTDDTALRERLRQERERVADYVYNHASYIDEDGFRITFGGNAVLADAIRTLGDENDQ